MKRTLLVATALCGLSLSAHAAQQKPAGWFAYQPGPQTCKQGSPPAVLIADVRTYFHVDPDVEDAADDNGKVVSTVITWPAAEGDRTWEIHMFRSGADCEAYAKTQRVDPHKYD
jgi:hypothetical protein